MLRLILLVLLVVLGFLAVRVGWPWLILVISLAVALAAFVLLERSPSRLKITFVLSAYVFQALLLAWGLLWSLQRVAASLTAGQGMEPAYRLAVGSPALQTFWALIAGFFIAALLFALPLGWMAEHSRRAAHGDQARNKSPSANLHRALGTIPAKWLVRDGQLITLKAAKPPRSPTTGPGEVEVQRGHALVLEKEGLIADILPAGVHWVNDQERLAMVVPLYGRSDRVTVRHATTGDGLQIADLEIMVFHKLHTDDATDQFGDDKFKFNKDIVQQKVWSAAGSTWEAAVRGITEREARGLIAGYTMEQFVTMNPSERDKFKTDLAAKVNTVTGEFLGVTVTITGLGTIDVPDLAAEKLMASWTAKKDRAVALSNAEQQNRILMSTAEARKEAFLSLAQAMTSILDSHHSAGDLVTMSFVERMERVEDGVSASNPNQELETLGKLYAIEALKSLAGRPASPDAEPAA
ncbi:MAG TPA: SPFH domain-containing protein [Anaerolineae bacterium]|nr:SPFH domain-containing protein [Anaerolineae bacterium]